MSLTRRRLLIAGPLAVTSLALAAPALAAEEPEWTEEFMTRPETREGFAVDAMDSWQVDNAKFIIAVATGHGIAAEGVRIALATAIVESWLYNYEPAVDLDSGGLFQQRPSMGWGSTAEVRHKRLAIEGFLGVGDHTANAGLLDVAPDPRGGDPGAIAQQIQSSAHPARYGAQAAAARIIWERYADQVEPFTG